MQPPVWAKVWATNGVRLRRKRVAGEPNHLKESQIPNPNFQNCVHSISLFVSHSHQHLPEALKRSAGRGRGWPAKIVCQPFPITMMMVTMMEVSNTILILIFVNNNMIPRYPLQDPTLSCCATCSCSWGLMWKVSARQNLVIITSFRFFLDSMKRKSQPPISKVTWVAPTHALSHKRTITTTKQNKIKSIKKEEGTET